MKAVTWQGHRKIEVATVPDPQIVEPTGAVIKVTTTGLCGSDLHLYEVLGPFLDAGDILGHEPMGVVAPRRAGRVPARPLRRHPPDPCSRGAAW